jgi:gas vesicle protein
MDDHYYQAEHSTFVTGFTIGLFAGAAGYFLFATKKGAQVRKQLSQDWEDAKRHLEKEGALEHAELSLGSYLKELLERALATEERVVSGLEAKGRKTVRAVEKSIASETAKVKKEAVRKFKGV